MARAIALTLGVAALLLPPTGSAGIDRLAASGAAAALVVLGGWALLVTIALLAARLPAAAGSWGRRTARRLLPAALHGLLGLTAVGLLPAAALADAGAPPILIDRVPAVAALPTPSPGSAAGPTAAPEPPRAAAPEPPARTATAAGRTVDHVVTAGDSLWSIAAADLPPGAGAALIDARWRQWWQYNRDAIGDDPDLIHVGLRLAAPPPDAT